MSIIVFEFALTLDGKMASFFGLSPLVPILSLLPIRREGRRHDFIDSYVLCALCILHSLYISNSHYIGKYFVQTVRVKYTSTPRRTLIEIVLLILLLSTYSVTLQWCDSIVLTEENLLLDLVATNCKH